MSFFLSRGVNPVPSLAVGLPRTVLPLSSPPRPEPGVLERRLERDRLADLRRHVEEGPFVIASCGGLPLHTVGLTAWTWPELLMARVCDDVVRDVICEIVEQCEDLGLPPEPGVRHDTEHGPVAMWPVARPRRACPLLYAFYEPEGLVPSVLELRFVP